MVSKTDENGSVIIMGMAADFLRTLVGMFDWIELRTNVGQKVVIVCHPIQAAVTQSEELYKQRMVGA